MAAFNVNVYKVSSYYNNIKRYIILRAKVRNHQLVFIRLWTI